MGFDSCLGDVQPFADLGVGPALGYQEKHLPFPLGKRRQPYRGVVHGRDCGDQLPGEAVEQPPGDTRRDHGIAAGNGPNRGKQLGGRRVLEKEPSGPGLKRGERILVGVERGEGEHPGRMPRGREFTRGGDPVHDRHPDIHHDNVGLDVPQESQGLGSVSSLTDNGHVVLRGENDPEPCPHQLLVVDNNNPDHPAPPGEAPRVVALAAVSARPENGMHRAGPCL
jgi:hypothetical protein